ncbi:hypothetical protein JCM10213v2_007562 [Rhodosporidiobolus nylandii]
MFIRATQKYGPVVTEDPPLSDSDVERPLAAPPPSAFPPRAHLFHAPGLQKALDAHPSPPKINEATRLLIRAIPILATLSWLVTLVTLLCIWLFKDDRVKYKWYLGAMPYLSDVGADNKTVFLIGNICTAVFYTMSLWQERLLRANRVMVEATDERLLWVAVGVLDVFVGATSFIVCVTLSGLLQTVEVEHLWHEHPDRHDLRDGTILKWITLLFSAACGIAFWVLYAVCDGDATKSPVEKCYRVTTASAILERAACFGCAAYLATLILDVWPPHRLSQPTPVVWADRSGIRGVWVAHPSTKRIPVELPLHLDLHRPPFHAGDAEAGRSCAVVLQRSGGIAGGVGGGRRDRAGQDDGADGFAWYEEGKRTKSPKEGRRL